MKWQEGSDSNAQYLSMAVLETAAIPFDDPPMKIFVSVDFVFPRVRFRPQRLAERREHPIIVYEASTKTCLTHKMVRREGVAPSIEVSQTSVFTALHYFS